MKNTRDPGLQPERTTLSAVRTVALALAVVLLMMRVMATHASFEAAAEVGILLGIGPLIVLLRLQAIHDHHVRTFSSEQAPPSVALNVWLALTVCGIAASTLVLTAISGVSP